MQYLLVGKDKVHFNPAQLEVLQKMAFLKDDQGKFVYKTTPGVKGAAAKLVAAFRFLYKGTTEDLRDKTIDDRFNRFRCDSNITYSVIQPVNDHEIVGLNSQVVNQVVESSTPTTLTTSTGATSTSSVHHLTIVPDSTFTMTAEMYAVCSKLVGEGADMFGSNIDEDNEHVAAVMLGCTHYQSERRAGVKRNHEAKVALYNKNVLQCTELINKTIAGEKELLD